MRRNRATNDRHFLKFSPLSIRDEKCIEAEQNILRWSAFKGIQVNNRLGLLLRVILNTRLRNSVQSTVFWKIALKIITQEGSLSHFFVKVMIFLVKRGSLLSVLCQNLRWCPIIHQINLRGFLYIIIFLPWNYRPHQHREWYRGFHWTCYSKDSGYTDSRYTNLFFFKVGGEPSS